MGSILWNELRIKSDAGYVSVAALRGKLPWWRCCSSKGEGILAVGSQRIPQSHTAQQTHTRELLEGPQGSGCLCLSEKQGGTKQKAGFI